MGSARQARNGWANIWDPSERGDDMAHTYPELKNKTLAELREIAAGIQHDAVQGATQMNKDHLLEAICKALNIDMHVHHEVKGIDKAAVKAKIREWQKKRDEA